ncbi:MAG: DUF2188 domain-containing protein [Candidatus Methanofastidiosia archaeon]
MIHALGSRIHETKEEAIKDAVTLAKKVDLGRVKIHEQTGEIQEEHTMVKIQKNTVDWISQMLL